MLLQKIMIPYIEENNNSKFKFFLLNKKKIVYLSSSNYFNNNAMERKYPQKFFFTFNTPTNNLHQTKLKHFKYIYF